MPPRLRSSDAMALVIEVLCEDGRFWHAMANEWERIINELNSAPTAHSITIYEYRLAMPVNPPDFFTKYPEWQRISVRPWTFDQYGNQDQAR